ncbi:MAG: response regulator [Actinobacteria bacterium]|nr:response regulator [Actinomycetota bacterium]
MVVKRTAVIAEDEALIRLDLVTMLSDSGIEVLAAVADGRAAIKAVETFKPDVALLDIAMPELDGITAASEITSLKICPVVMITAYSQVELVERAANAGAMGYLVKPINPANLMPAIEVAIARFEELNLLTTEVTQVTERLEVRKIVDRAKGLLQAKLGIDEPAAFRWLQKAAMDNRSSIRDVAQGVVDQMGNL